jgi:hypothetical protein
VIRNKLALLAGLALISGGANAAIVQAGIGTAAHTYYAAGGSNGAAAAVIWGDGANLGLSPLNYCYDNGTSAPFHQCNEYLNSGATASGTPTGLPYVAAPGNNGLYWGNPTPAASYHGAVLFDDAITFVDPSDGFTYFRVTGGALQWAGTYGFEVLNLPSPTSGAVGGSFFSYAFNDSGIDLATGARALTTNSGAPGVRSNCYLGSAGAIIVGSLLCGFANPATGYNYSNVGTSYTKSANWAGVRFNGDGSVGHLLLTSTRYTSSGQGNNIREELDFSVVPVPAAVWLFGSALGVMGLVRRKKAAATA